MKFLERCLWLAILAACTVVLLSSATRAEPLVPSVALFWWRWLLVFSVAMGLGLFIVGWLAEKLTKRQAYGVVVLLAGSAFLIVALFVNRIPTQRLLGLGGDPPGGASSTVAFVLLLLATILTMAGGKGSGWWYRGASILALGVFALWIWPQGTATNGAFSLPQTQPTGQRLLVIGLDGADWVYIDPLIERGELPNIQRLLETGVRGPLATLRPTRSPALWTTVVTGKKPRDHGIRWHAVVRAKGGRHSLPKPKAMAKGFGIKTLHGWLASRGQIVSSPATSLERRVPAFWNMTTAYDSPLDVINWWATWPAEAILGRMVTDRTYFWRWAARGFGEVDEAITFPESLYRQLSPMVMRPDEVSLVDARQFMDIDAEAFASSQDASYQHHELLSEFKYYYSMFETHRRFVTYFFDRAEAEGVVPSDLMVIFRLIDMLSHSSLEYSELVEDHLGHSSEDVRRFGGAVSEAYRRADRVLGDMIASFGDGNVILISDHGFRLERPRKRETYNHSSGPSGIFLASGPAFAQGEVEDLSLFHILPILLAVKGYPVPTDIVARVPTQILATEFLEEHPVTMIESYGTIDLQRETGESAVDQEMMERLEALGYLD